MISTASLILYYSSILFFFLVLISLSICHVLYFTILAIYHFSFEKDIPYYLIFPGCT